MTTHTLACLVALACTAASCNNGGNGADASVATDAMTDAQGTDAGIGMDVSVVGDGGTDADAGMDVVTDTGVDIGTDTGVDIGGNAYGCLGDVSTPATTLTMAAVTLNLVAYGTSPPAPLVGVTVKACAVTDPSCATPESMGTTDPHGAVTLSVALGTMGFAGYFDVSGGTGANTVTPALLFSAPPVTQAMATETWTLVTPSFQPLAAIGATLDPTHGTITAVANECAGQLAVGASFSTRPPLASGYYVFGMFPTLTAMATGASGTGGFINVAAGSYVLSAAVMRTSARIATVSVVVRGGAITQVSLAPTS